MLNFPRTGSTFAREVIKKIHSQRLVHSPFTKIMNKLNLKTPSLLELDLPNYQSPNPLTRNTKGQHGAYCQIPKAYLPKEIVTVMRNPYEIFLSTYQLGWWKKDFPLEKKTILENFPNFPILTMNEYVKLIQLSVEDKTGINIGAHTVQFIRIFFKNPDEVLSNISENYLQSDDLCIKDIAPDITILQQENLNEELAFFLAKHGYTKKETDFVRNHKRVNTSTYSVPDKNSLWTEEAINYVEESERFLFRILKNRGFVYKKPVAQL